MKNVFSVIKVSRNGLEWIQGGKSLPLMFPETAVKNEEILDKALAKKAILDFVSKEIKGKVREVNVVLTDELVFEKTFGVSEGNLENRIEEFWNEVPIEPAKLGKIVVRGHEVWTAYGTNKELYCLVVEELEKNRIKVVRVVAEKMGPDKPELNFLKADREVGFEESGEKEMGGRKRDNKIVVLGGVLILALVIMIMALYKGGQSLVTKKISPTGDVKTMVEASRITPTPVVTSDIAARELKILVLNGSGISGKAAEVKSLMQGLGYMDIAIGNAPGESIGESTIRAKLGRKKLIETLAGDLKEKTLFSSDSGDLAEEDPNDIQITLGKNTK